MKSLLNVYASTSFHINAGCPQCSILRPTQFLIYIKVFDFISSQISIYLFQFYYQLFIPVLKASSIKSRTDNTSRKRHPIIDYVGQGITRKRLQQHKKLLSLKHHRDACMADVKLFF